MKRKVFYLACAAPGRAGDPALGHCNAPDGFTMDEAYHIAAGASYSRFGDFRLNPEHPPLVKLWVGTVMAVTGFHLDPLRRFSDKPDERVF